MNKLIPALLILGIMAGCGNQEEKQAEEAPAPQLVADLEAGKSAAMVCGGCHGDIGISDMAETPHLAGQSIDYLKNAMLAYKNGERAHELMKTAVSMLSEQEIVNLAGFYANLPAPDGNTNPEPPPVAEATDTEVAEPETATAPAAAASCSGCHGATGVSAIPGTPSLAALDKDYLVIATKAYKTQERQDPVMMGMVAALSDEDITAISEFYAAQTLENTPTAASGDAAAGEAGAAACAGCHGADGNSSSPAANPSLAAQDALYLVNAMKAYKNNTRANAVMPGMVAALGDADLENIAAFYASKSRSSTAGEEEATREPMTAVEWAEKCDRCHSKEIISQNPTYPSLANQRADYLAKAIATYQNEERHSSTMHKMSLPLMAEEIEAIANYYSRQ